MKEIPILMSTPMVQATMAGTKKMTRRIIKPQPDENGVDFMPDAPCLDWEQIYNDEWKPWLWETEENESIAKFCPYGQPGDVLWVREMFCPTENNDYMHKVTGKPYFYKADVAAERVGSITDTMKEYGWKWKPSIHMPKAACRLWLKVISIKTERLQDISESDALAEGIREIKGPWYIIPASNKGKLSAKAAFNDLWETINGEESWLSNPWVWVISFQKIEKP